MRSKAEIKILLVDDEVVLLKPLKRVLERMEIKVDVANEGHAALEMHNEIQYDAIVTDLRMSPGDGLELLETLKSKNSKRPVVIMSPGFFSVPLRKCFQLGMEAAFLKPFEPDLLLKKIKWLLQPVNEKIQKTVSGETPSILGSGGLLGRGGLSFFMRGQISEVKEEQMICFEVNMKESFMFKGNGWVRWVDRESNWVGVELTQVSDQRIVALITEYENKGFVPYIPSPTVLD